MLADLPNQMGLRHEKCPSEAMRRLLMIDGRGLMDQAMGEFVSQGQTPPFQRVVPIDYNHWHWGQVSGPLDQAGHTGHTLREGGNTDLDTALLKEFGHIWDRILTKVPDPAHPVC